MKHMISRKKHEKRCIGEYEKGVKSGEERSVFEAARNTHFPVVSAAIDLLQKGLFEYGLVVLIAYRDNMADDGGLLPDGTVDVPF